MDATAAIVNAPRLRALRPIGDLVKFKLVLPKQGVDLRTSPIFDGAQAQTHTIAFNFMHQKFISRGVPADFQVRQSEGEPLNADTVSAAILGRFGDTRIALSPTNDQLFKLADGFPRVSAELKMLTQQALADRNNALPYEQQSYTTEPLEHYRAWGTSRWLRTIFDSPVDQARYLVLMGQAIYGDFSFSADGNSPHEQFLREGYSCICHDLYHQFILKGLSQDDGLSFVLSSYIQGVREIIAGTLFQTSVQDQSRVIYQMLKGV